MTCHIACQTLSIYINEHDVISSRDHVKCPVHWFWDFDPACDLKLYVLWKSSRKGFFFTGFFTGFFHRFFHRLWLREKCPVHRFWDFRPCEKACEKAPEKDSFSQVFSHVLTLWKVSCSQVLKISHVKNLWKNTWKLVFHRFFYRKIHRFFMGFSQVLIQ